MLFVASLTLELSKQVFLPLQDTLLRFRAIRDHLDLRLQFEIEMQFLPNHLHPQQFETEYYSVMFLCLSPQRYLNSPEAVSRGSQGGL